MIPVFILSLLGGQGCSKNTQTLSHQNIFATESYTEQTEFYSTIPLHHNATKMHLTATINEQPFQFMLDTGSPTIVTKRVADLLELPIMGTNTGVDSNGTEVTMNVSIVDAIGIGEVVFRQVPVFIWDPSTTTDADCFFDGGVIGSELLPLAVWQFNLQNNTLVIANDSRKVEHTKNAKQAALLKVGYPHYPIVQHQINNGFTDNALFDTGSTELLHLNQLAYEQMRKDNVLNAPVGEGRGSFGKGAGGEAENSVYVLNEVKSLTVGNLQLQDLKVWTRNTPPTLIGSRILDTHIVTLDYQNQAVYFKEYALTRTSTGFGFRASFNERSQLQVSFISKPSIAVSAGLQIHDQIIAINNQTVSVQDQKERCEVLQTLPSILAEESVTITVLREGKEQSFALAKESPQIK